MIFIQQSQDSPAFFPLPELLEHLEVGVEGREWGSGKVAINLGFNGFQTGNRAKSSMGLFFGVGL